MRDSRGENSPEIYHSPPGEIAPGRTTIRSQTLGDDRVRRDPSVRSPTFAFASPRRPPLRRARLPRRSIDHLAPPTTSARAVLFAEGARRCQIYPHFFSHCPPAAKTRPDPTRARARRAPRVDGVDAGIGFPPSRKIARAVSRTRNAFGILTDHHRSIRECDRRAANLRGAGAPRGRNPRDIPQASASFPPSRDWEKHITNRRKS